MGTHCSLNIYSILKSIFEILRVSEMFIKIISSF